MTVVPSRKSSVVISSCGLWLPFSLRTKIIPIGTPAAANAAASCEAGLPISNGNPLRRRGVLQPRLDDGIHQPDLSPRDGAQMEAHAAPLLDAGDDPGHLRLQSARTAGS